MACVNPDGSLSTSATAILTALRKPAGPAAGAEQVAAETSLPLFRIRSGLRELAEAGLVQATDTGYVLTEMGRKRVP